jgi:ATP-binding cassette subfamily B protein
MRGGGWMSEAVVDETLSRDEAQRVVRRLVRRLRPWRAQVALAVALLALQVGTVLAGPALIAYGIDHGVRKGDTGALNVAAAVFLGVAFAGLVLGRAAILVTTRIGESFLRDLRISTFRHLLRLSMPFFEKEKTGRLVARMTSDIDAMQELVSQGLVLAVTNALLFVGVVIAIFLKSWQLACVTLVVVPPIYLASRWFRRRSNAAYLEVRDRLATNLSTLQEGLAGIRVVQAFGREGAFRDRFRGTNESQFRAELETVRISSLYFPVIEASGVFGVALIIGIGGIMSVHGIVTVGTIAAFVLYLINLSEPVQQLSQLYNTVQQAGAALQKVFTLLDTPPSVAEKPGAVDLVPAAIEVDDVTFAYGDTPVLRDVSLRIEAGERVALVGPTGAGKSTLAKLIARFYDPVEGAVRVGGTDLRDVTLRSLREHLVVVPQEGFMFAGTLRDNLLVGRPDATDEEMWHAIRALGVESRFAALPDGLDTEVRERGSRLSAGERQLVSLVRAALADPEILVLDEATSNLDPGTERVVEGALERLMGRRSVVVIAHRLSTAARADRIAVIDDGRLVELGTHAELLRREGRYAALYASWIEHHPDGEEVA